MTKTKFILAVLNYLPAAYAGIALGLLAGKVLGNYDGLSWWWVLAPIYGPIAAVLTVVWFAKLHYYATTTPEERADHRLTRAIQGRAAGDLQAIFGEDVTR